MARIPRKVKIFSALEVANLCGVVNQTAINWIHNGYLSAFTTPGGQYRVYAEDLATFLESRGMRSAQDVETNQDQSVEWNMILIIDDDAELNNIVKRYVELHFPEYLILQAFDGFEAGRFLGEKRPGFVFLDLDLPGIDGYALCKRIKEDPIFGKPFVIAITGLSSPDAKERILNEGADAFFPKPLEFEALIETVRELGKKVMEKDGKR